MRATAAADGGGSSSDRARSGPPAHHLRREADECAVGLGAYEQRLVAIRPEIAVSRKEKENETISSVSVIAPSSAFASYAKKDKLGLILELIGLVSVVRRQRFVMGRPVPSSRSKRDIAVYHPPFS
jgi:hypothetical protein